MCWRGPGWRCARDDAAGAGPRSGSSVAGGRPVTPPAAGRFAALAKLTLSLHVTGVRTDGYHLLDAEMVTVDLADSLEFSEGDGLEVAGAAAEAVPGGDDNLVRRALLAVGRRAAVRLTKRIPAGAGLGGGSADAAAVLRWAGCRDLSVAATLGADVPFCLVGGRARVSGVGEVVDPLPFDAVAGRTFTLLIPAVRGVHGRGLPGLRRHRASASGRPQRPRAGCTCGRASPRRMA